MQRITSTKFMPRRSIVNRRCGIFRGCAIFFASLPKKSRSGPGRARIQRSDRPSMIEFATKAGANPVGGALGLRVACAGAGSSRSSAASDLAAPERGRRGRRRSAGTGPRPCRAAASAGRCGRAGRPSGSGREGLAAGQEPVIGALELQGDDGADEAAGLGAGRDLLGEGPEVPARARRGRRCPRRRWSRARSTSAPGRGDGAGVLAVGEAPEAVAEAAEAAEQAARGRGRGGRRWCGCPRPRGRGRRPGRRPR